MVKNFMTKENITLLVAILGFVLSLSSWIYNIATQRRSFSVKCTEYKAYNKVIIFFLHIENHSRLPISISRISLNTPSGLLDCVSRPSLVLSTDHRSGDVVTSRKDFYSLQIPIPITSLGAISGYILFENVESLLPTGARQADFVIYTNRGSSVQRTIELP